MAERLSCPRNSNEFDEEFDKTKVGLDTVILAKKAGFSGRCERGKVLGADRREGEGVAF